MTDERWNEIWENDLPLTKEEIDQGWHYCPDFDDLLIGPGMGELQYCQ